MSLFMTILNLLLSFFTLAMTGVMLFNFRKPRRVTVFSSLISALISLILPVIFLAITGEKPDLRLTLPFFSFGLILGFLRGVTMKLEFFEGQVVGRHSILFLFLWGFSLALNQALSTFNSSIILAVGLISLFISTGTQVGFYGILAARRLVLVPPEMDSAKLSNKAAQRFVSLAFGGLLLVFVVETILLCIPALPFFLGVKAAPLGTVEELTYSPVEEEGEIQTEEVQSKPEPYFNGEEILIWTRPLEAFLSESEQNLYAFSSDGSNVRKVYDEPLSAVDSPAPLLSPDGSLWIVTSKRTGDLQQYLMTVDGSRTYQLLYQDTPVTIQDWSLDGSQILVQSQVSDTWDVLLTDREGGEWQVLANQPADEIEPRMSPDGEIVLYQSNQNGNQEIYAIDPRGGMPVNLTNNSAEDKRASWALNGSRIVFTSDREGLFGLYHMNPDGSDLQLIAQDPSCGYQYLLSPDGDHILYTSDSFYLEAGWDNEMVECRSTTRTLASLTGGVIITLEINDSDEPGWSPDGSKILFVEPYDESAKSQGLFVIRADGTGLAELTPPSNEIFLSTWSADSTRIAQVEGEPQPDETTWYVVSVTDANGGNRRELAPIPWEPGIAFAFWGFSWP